MLDNAAKKLATDLADQPKQRKHLQIALGETYFALGLFGSTAVNAAGANGLLFGGADFFFKQLVAVVGASAYAFLFTYGALKLINLITPVRTSDVEEANMDETLHGETAYIEAI